MAMLTDVEIPALDLGRFAEVLTADRYGTLQSAVARAHQVFAGRSIWNVNSTARGGGVAEMLQSLLAYARGASVDARWTVISGDPDFFRVTKRIHNRLHGAAGDGGPLGREERDVYERTLRDNAEELLRRVRPTDVVILHDPQTAGLIPALRGAGVPVVWRCHVGLDMPNDLARQAWRFLSADVAQADTYIFSRRAFAWEGLDADHMWVIPPSIDAFSPKNAELTADHVAGILCAAGVLCEEAGGEPLFRRGDGGTGRVERRAVMVEEAPLRRDDRVVLQVSRWDRLKDPVGVIAGFVRQVRPHTDAHLVLAGPAVEAVSDDPEGAVVLAECTQRWHELAPEDRGRVHLACLPMQDGEENAAMVNALQRHAEVVVQKSLAEGFGLTVAEAMWKARPVVASRIGGIQDQIEDGVTGVLLRDPADVDAYGGAVRERLLQPAESAQMGLSARERVRDQFLGPRHLIQYLELLSSLLDGHR